MFDEVDLTQMSLFDTVKDDDILEELKTIENGNLTSIEALNKLAKLQNKKKPLVEMENKIYGHNYNLAGDN